MSKTIDLSVVIPAYNEKERIFSSLSSIIGYLEKKETSFEIIIVDDCSSDGMGEAISDQYKNKSFLKIHRNKHNLGKGGSVKQGISLAQGKSVLFTDADLSTPIEEIDKLEAALHAGASVAIASRDLPQSKVSPPQPLYREWMGKIFNKMVQLIVLPGIQDTQCGFKLFESELAQRVFSQTTISGFGFDVELLYLTRKFGGTIKEVPVSWHDVLGSKVSPLRDATEMFIDLFRVRWRHRRLKK